LSIIKKSPKLFLYNKIDENHSWHSGYLIHFNSGVQQWKKNKVLGSGLKSFRLNCTYENNQTCNTHPHNYFIELLVDTGLMGSIIIYLVFIIGFKNFLIFYLNQKNINLRLTSVVFFLTIFFEFFPLRSSGSFFTTNNATFIFLILPFFLNIKKINKLK
jgi:O-antigen ligase